MKPLLPLKIVLKFQVLKGAITSTAFKTWNDIQKITKDVLLNSFSPAKLRLFLNIFFSDFHKDPR